MIKIKKVMQKVSKTDDVVCDLCGKSCRFVISEKEDIANFNYATITPKFGYGSKLDGIEYEKQICEDCYTKIFGGVDDEEI